MDILIGVLSLAGLWCFVVWPAILLGKHGRPGLMRIVAARLRARADGDEAGRAKQKESLAFYMSEIADEKEKVTL